MIRGHTQVILQVTVGRWVGRSVSQSVHLSVSAFRKFESIYHIINLQSNSTYQGRQGHPLHVFDSLKRDVHLNTMKPAYNVNHKGQGFFSL
jgi:hypothetical protein